MKKNIHPNWQHTVVVTCACGNKFETGSTATELTVDICSACHPFFTGEMKFVDRQGRVDKFRQKMAAAAQLKAKQSKKTKKKADEPAEAQSYKQLLQQQQQVIKQVAKNRLAA
jgi:large subunit ribosomal protein L31